MNKFMERAIELSRKSVDSNGGPFGAIITLKDEIISEGMNRVTLSPPDPTAHAEIMAIRAACKKLNTFKLDQCVLWTSCFPCPGCYSFLFWARISKIYYACTHKDAAAIDFDDSRIYSEFTKKVEEKSIPMTQIMHKEGKEVFKYWDQKADKVKY